MLEIVQVPVITDEVETEGYLHDGLHKDLGVENAVSGELQHLEHRPWKCVEVEGNRR